MSQPDTIALLGINNCLQIIETGVRWVVLCLSQDGACTDSFENFRNNSLKGGLSNDITLNPPLFSLVNTFKRCKLFALFRRDRADCQNNIVMYSLYFCGFFYGNFAHNFQYLFLWVFIVTLLITRSFTFDSAGDVPTISPRGIPAAGRRPSWQLESPRIWLHLPRARSPFFAACWSLSEGGTAADLTVRRTCRHQLPSLYAHVSWADRWCGRTLRWTQNQRCGSGMSISDPIFFSSRIRFFPCLIRIKELKYFNPKNGFWALGNMIWVVNPGSGSWFFTPHPGSRGQKGIGSRIRIRNTAQNATDYHILEVSLSENGHSFFLCCSERVVWGVLQQLLLCRTCCLLEPRCSGTSIFFPKCYHLRKVKNICYQTTRSDEFKLNNKSPIKSCTFSVFAWKISYF